ncbi:ATP-binding cassette domain-containing protein [Tumebacillus lipolyticus]|uniref:ATP-binding cassette domain-containing protein n=1 Tax=Tumebacillus lipolyticus TaxID=1280370 RepID=A0ABW5A0X5_9BACL
MAVKVEHVSFGQILHDLSFTLEDGSITLLVGQTGAGKSSLLDLLTGLTRFDAGSITYDEVPLWKGKRVDSDVLRDIGVVFQFPDHQLFARTVQHEFDYSLKPLRLTKAEAAARTREALAQIGLSEELTSQSPLALSGGQKRRVALATTFATEPKWLFLDEPTAGLDPQAVQRLVALLQSAKGQRAGGIVIATHDLDSFFPLADRVLLLDRGRLAACASPKELCEQPDLMQQARVGLPASTMLSLAFQERGIDLPAHPLPPEQMAEIILQQRGGGDREQHRLIERSAQPEPAPANGGRAGVDEIAEQALAASAQLTTGATASAQPPARRTKQLGQLIRQLDPRAKWAFYLLVSLGILVQSNWSGLALATLITLGCMGAANLWQREVWRLVKPFLFFILISLALSGLRFQGGISFDVAAALNTFGQLYRFLLLMVLGVWLSSTTGQLKMKQGLETSLAPLKKLKLPVEAFALATSLMLRFVPVILQEMRRFSRISKARGKSVKGALRLRDIGAVVVPLLLSVLRLGEELSVAMEARGYAKLGIRRTSATRLCMVQNDWKIILIGGLLFALLVSARYL